MNHQNLGMIPLEFGFRLPCDDLLDRSCSQYEQETAPKQELPKAIRPQEPTRQIRYDLPCGSCNPAFHVDRYYSHTLLIDVPVEYFVMFLPSIRLLNTSRRNAFNVEIHGYVLIGIDLSSALRCTKVDDDPPAPGLPRRTHYPGSIELQTWRKSPAGMRSALLGPNRTATGPRLSNHVVPNFSGCSVIADTEVRRWAARCRLCYRRSAATREAQQGDAQYREPGQNRHDIVSHDALRAIVNVRFTQFQGYDSEINPLPVEMRVINARLMAIHREMECAGIPALESDDRRGGSFASQCVLQALPEKDIADNAPTGLYQ